MAVAEKGKRTLQLREDWILCSRLFPALAWSKITVPSQKFPDLPSTTPDFLKVTSLTKVLKEQVNFTGLETWIRGSRPPVSIPWVLMRRNAGVWTSSRLVNIIQWGSQLAMGACYVHDLLQSHVRQLISAWSLKFPTRHTRKLCTRSIHSIVLCLAEVRTRWIKAFDPGWMRLGIRCREEALQNITTIRYKHRSDSEDAVSYSMSRT